MTMKEHILAALREQFDRWQETLAGMSEEEITTARLPAGWTVKDDIAHLWAWQQRSLARLHAAVANHKPRYPRWAPGIDPDRADNTNRTNAWIYETYRHESWPQVYRKWREGFLQLLDIGEQVPEPALLDSSRYDWLEGYPLANTLLATYDHHQEHLDKLLAWQRERE